MTSQAPSPISIDEAFESVVFMPDRTPHTESTDHFATLTDYRDGGMYLAHYAGNSEWERHGLGDEIVLVLEGSTTLTLLLDGEEVSHTMGRREFIVVPQGVWHRFETPESVKVMSVTPQPSDHQTERPTD